MSLAFGAANTAIAFDTPLIELPRQPTPPVCSPGYYVSVVRFSVSQVSIGVGSKPWTLVPSAK